MINYIILCLCLAAWWMTAASSSLTQGTSTTLQRSSEVRNTQSTSLVLLRPDIITHTAVCLHCGLRDRDAAESVMLCFFGDSHNISARWTSNRAAFDYVNGMCACWTLLHACVYSCVRSLAHLASGGGGRWRESALMLICWKTTRLKSCLSNKSLEMPLWVNSLLLAPMQEVELMTLGSQAGGLCLWGEAWPDFVQRV